MNWNPILNGCCNLHSVRDTSIFSLDVAHPPVEYKPNIAPSNCCLQSEFTCLRFVWRIDVCAWQVEYRSDRKYAIETNGVNGEDKSPKLPLPFRRSPPQSSAPIPWPTQLTIPNGFGSKQYTFHQTHTHTDRWARRQVSKISTYDCYHDRKRRANNI